MIMFVVILPVLNLIPCEINNFCNGGVVENSVEAIRQIGESWMLIGLTVAILVNTAFFNWTGVAVTQNSSSLARSTLDISRTVFI